jgi:tetratricopeptide (TPR) repeat protein
VNAQHGSLQHLAFFEALAGMEEFDGEWPATSAGLVVLRLVDAWLDEGPEVAAPDGWSVRAVREAIDAVAPERSVRPILSGIVDVLQSSSGQPSVSRIAPRLMAYGRALDYDGRYALAADVYGTLVAHAHPADEPDVAIDANMQLGLCRRRLGDLDGAARAYGRAGAIAASTGDLMKVLLSQVADAKIAVARGNLPSAEQTLDRTIERAREHAFSEVQGLALHERSAVAHLRGDYERAVRFAYQALGLLGSPVARDRVLGDLAASFVLLGVRSAARDALMVLAATAQDQYSRWVATINLLELEAMDGCEPRFEDYRRQMDAASLPPSLEAEYALSLGTAYQTLDRPEQARLAFHRALAIAAEHSFNQILFRAEQSLRELSSGKVSYVTPAVAPPATVADVAEAIGEMRTMVGV